MWSKFAKAVLRYRVALLVFFILLTAFFGYHGYRISLTYSYPRALPVSDPIYQEYEEFKKLYGEDGNVLVIGFTDSNLFQLDKFNAWYDLTEKIKTIKGINEVLSVSKVLNMKRNDSLKKFELTPVFASKPKTQAELDSLKQVVFSLPFYDKLLYNRETNATVLAATFDKKDLESKNRLKIVQDILDYSNVFAKQQNVELHYSGMPFIRTNYMKKISSEMGLFMLLAVLITAIILYAFFRSFFPVLFSIIVCLVGVVLSLGTLKLFGYNITVLSGLIPPLIMVIGVPNCIFIINKYQEELSLHGNKYLALSKTIEKVSLSNFLANITTSIGFGVFYFTNSVLLMEFGIVAALNVMATYAVSHMLLPIIYSFLPAPKPKYTKHLNNKYIANALSKIDYLVHNKRKLIYLLVVVLTVISVVGMYQIKVVGYVVDDLPKKDPIYSHLKYFENNFKGVIPFEVNIDTKKDNGVFSNNAKTLYKIKSFQKELEKYEEFSKPFSAVEALKFAYQSYKDGNPKYYILPGSLELKKLSEYTSTVKGKESKLASFIDSTKRFTRISFQMADVGSIRMKELISEIKPIADTIFNYDKEEEKWLPDSLKYKVMLTGFSIQFLKGNDYLFHHLFVSLIIAIVLIVLIGMILFRSIAIIVLSKVPCLIPLVFTAGIMGFFNIHFKASTILIFSIAFGIASDGTVYILTEYRNQLRKSFAKGEPIGNAISLTIRELGLSMIYTNIILFFGFSIFAVSSFGGTVAMGILISITLLVSLITNLVLLPCILLSLEKRKQTKLFMQDSLIQIVDEEEDIDTDKLIIEDKQLNN